MDVVAYGAPAGGRVATEILFDHGGSAEARVEREAARDGPVEDAESGAHDIRTMSLARGSVKRGCRRR